MLIQVLAPGLALNGPVGSMARATDGMRVELNHVLSAFSLMMITFAVSTILALWIVMDEYAAFGSTCVFGIAFVLWYYHIYRVLARFSFNSGEGVADWADFNDRSDEPTVGLVDGCVGDNHSHGANGGHNTRGNGANNPLQVTHHHHSTDSESASTDFPERVPPKQKSSKRLSVKFMSWLNVSPSPSNSGKFGGNTSSNSDKSNNSLEMSTTTTTQQHHKTSTISSAQSVRSNNTGMTLTTGNGNKICCTDTAMEGYFTKRVKSRGENIFTKSQWDRMYFVLNYQGELYYYKNRAIFRSDPINGREEARPIELDEYTVKYYNSLTSSTGGSEGDVFSVGDDSTIPTLSSKKLTNILRHWGFRCDTEEEWNQWLEVMQS
eukprot:gene37221-45926_t